MQTRKICFVGRHNLARHFWRNLVQRLERARPGELEGFRQQRRLRRTMRLDDAQVIFARNVPEKTTDRGLGRITRLVERADDGTRLIINPPSSFLYHDSKDRAFSAWSQAGLTCPRHWVLWPDPTDPASVACVDRVQTLLQQEHRLLLRTNNETRSEGLQIVDRQTPRERILEVIRTLKERVVRLRRTRSDSRIIAVQYIDARDQDGYASLARAFVLLDRVIGYFAVVSDKYDFRVSSLVPQSFDRFIEANRQLRQMVEDPRISSEIVRSVSTLGNNIGAVEFLVRDGVPVFLEVNPIWGGVPGPYSFGNEDFKRLLQQTEDHWSRELPNIVDNLNVVPFYRGLYEYIAEYAETTSCQADPVSHKHGATRRTAA